jgi:hypothetical protein
MQRIVLALAATLVGTAFVAALPSSASASARNHPKIKHAKHLQARYQKKAQRVVKKAKRVVELESKGTKSAQVERKAKHVATKAQRVVEKAHKHGLAQAEPARRAVHAKLDPPDTTNALVALAMRYDGQNPTGWSHNWCAHYLDMVLKEGGYPSGGNLARGYASYGQPTPARVGAIAVMAHHVGVVAFVGDDYVVLVSGNHSGSSGQRTVGLGRYAMSRVMTFRMPTMTDEPKLTTAAEADVSGPSQRS